MPGECTFEEVEDDVADGFEIVAAGLLITQMRIQTSIPCSSSQVFAILERNMLTIRRFVAFSEAKIDDVNRALG